MSPPIEMRAPPSTKAPPFSRTAEAEGLEMHQRQDAETVVEERDVDVVRCEARLRPQLVCGVAPGARRVGELVPRWSVSQRHAHRVEAHRTRPEVAQRLRARDDHCDRHVDRYIAVVEAQRIGDHPCRQVVVHRERIAVDRIGVEAGVAALHDRDPRQLFARDAVLVHVSLRVRRDPVGDAERTERRQPVDGPLHRGNDAQVLDALSALGPLSRGFDHRLVHQHVACQSAGDGQAGVHNGGR